MTEPVFSPVQSSNISAVAHDGDALIVQFKNGTMYRYPSAGREHHQAMMSTDSPGRYFADRIRHFHKGEKVG